MLFMNDYDIESAVNLWGQRMVGDAPETHRLALDLERLAAWANANSDGWAYWPKPCRAARLLQEHLQQCERDYRNGVDTDVIEANSASVRSRILAPVRSFLTKQGVPWSEVLR